MTQQNVHAHYQRGGHVHAAVGHLSAGFTKMVATSLAHMAAALQSDLRNFSGKGHHHG